MISGKRNIIIRLSLGLPVCAAMTIFWAKVMVSAEYGGIAFFNSGGDYIAAAIILPIVYIIFCRVMAKKLPVENGKWDAGCWAMILIVYPVATLICNFVS